MKLLRTMNGMALRFDEGGDTFLTTNLTLTGNQVHVVETFPQ